MPKVINIAGNAGIQTDELLTDVFGCPDGATTVRVAVLATSSEQVLSPSKVYRFCSDVNVYVNLDDVGRDATAASGMFMWAGNPEIFSTTATKYTVNTLRYEDDGYLWITEMVS